MPAPLSLPRLAWGDPSCPRRALLVHGLGSNASLMWRFGLALAEAGWHAEAVDLRGHGRAPRALDYTLDAYAGDLAHLHPSAGGAWELVLAHSLGGTAATLVAGSHPRWTRRLVLVDPAIRLDARERELVRLDQLASLEHPGADAVRAEHPLWHDQDVELKAAATLQASRWAIEQTSAQNEQWDVRHAAAALTMPTHVLAGDPEVFSLFTGAVVADVLANPAVSMTVIAGAGHSPHRDKPAQTIATLMEVLS